MIRFLRDVALFALLQSLLIGGLLWLFYDVREVSPLSPATVVKHQRLREAASPRMILIGGSNLLFGLDSPMIERQTPYHPVNMGLIGGLRLEYILNEIDASLRPGDLVVMCLEYNTLNAAADSDEAQVIMGVAAQRAGTWRYLTWPQWKSLLDRGVVAYLGVLFRQSFSDILVRGEDEEPGINHDMNRFGDLTRYHDPAVKPRSPNNQNTIIKIRPDQVQANIDRMNRFIAECAARQVKVMFAYPPVPRTHFQDNQAVARRFHRLLRAQLDAPVICVPADMVFPDRDFIGLSYHLRGHAVQERTQRLINAVNRRLEKDARGEPATQPEDEALDGPDTEADANAPE